jgi:hypothetical protein
MTQVTVFAPESSALIIYVDKKSGNDKSLSAEGALFKGGAALAALKDSAIDSAFTKARNGKYRAAAEIIGVAFPRVQKACNTLLGDAFTNKTSMKSFLAGVELAEEPAKGWSAKQVNAKLLVNSLRNIPSLAKDEVAEQLTVDA